jgi:tetratricopeptide (TPR) repeat protein
VISFAAAWIFITLLPVTNLLPTIGPLPAERFVYLASVGSSILLGWIAWRAYEYRPESLRTWPAIVAVVTGWFVLYSAALSIQGSGYYTSDVAWARGVRSTNTRFTMFRGAAAQHLEKAGLLKEARAEYQVTLAQGSEHPLDWIGLARVERKLGRKARALELLTEAKDKIPNNSAIYYQLGICYAETEDMGHAASAFEQAIQINPKHGPAWRNLGKANLKLGKYAEAVSAFQQAFKLIQPSPKDRSDLERAREAVMRDEE